MTSNKQLSERNICIKYIDLTLKKIDWDIFFQIQDQPFNNWRKTEKKQVIIFENLKQTLNTNTNEDIEILQANLLYQCGIPIEILQLVGGRKQYLKALTELERQIYKVV